MQISIHYEPEQNVLYSKATGAASIEDIMGYYSKIEHMNFKPGYSVLVDCSEVSSGISFDDIVLIVERRSELHREIGPEKIAIVAKKDVVFGLARVFGSMIEQKNIEANVFRDEEKALQWLGLSCQAECSNF